MDDRSHPFVSEEPDAPPVKMPSAAERLRAMAEMLETGASVTEVASRFRVPVRVLHRMVSNKRKAGRRSGDIVTADMLRRAAEMITEGYTFALAAKTLHVKTSTLTMHMLKNGLSATKLRGGSPRVSGDLSRAIARYREGMPVAEIVKQTGVPSRTLYSHLRKQGIAKRQLRIGEMGRERLEGERGDHHRSER